MAELKPYPAYKDSGVEWLGEIPAHWEMKKLSRITECLDGRRVPLNAQERGEMRGSYPYWGANSIVDHVNDWLFDEELVLIGEDGAPFFDSGRPVAFHVSGRIWVNNHMHVLRPNSQIVPSFLFNVLNCVDYRAFIEGSTRDKLTQGDMNAILIQCPPGPEQRTIAVFLDRETARIDALVAKKERLIELLQEKRIALISHAVTKGLAPDVPMKDSGVEWLGEIPAHWELKRIKGLLVSRKGAIKTGPFGSHLHSSEMMDSEIKVFNQRTVIDRDIFSGLNYISMGKFNELRAFESFPGDLLVTARGTIGRCMIVPREAPRGILHPCLLRIQIDKRLAYDHYIELLIEESGLILEQLKFMSNSTTIEVIYSDSLKETLFPIPPLLEQRTIAAFLDRETAKIDALVAKVREAIDHLKELRTTLISAAVTGKIDVRQAAA